MRPWARRWGLPGLEEAITVRFDPRLHRSAGRSRPERGEISLHPALAVGPKRAMASVLCHEMAHVAAYQLHGVGVPPHGAEWSALVRQAGHRPAPTARASTLGIPVMAAAASRPEGSQPSVRQYVHRCPVCQSSRVARRPVRAWRCAECVAAGLEGRLTITVRDGART
jgi:predicted SprT family Zn-dependent metalloprotease